MYFGQFEHSLDDKGRLMIPSKLREGLVGGSPLFIIRGLDGCLAVYNENGFSKFVEKVESRSFDDMNVRKYIRNVLPSVVQLNVDKLGRIQIPTATLAKYNISNKVMVIGVGDHFEIWDLNAYLDYEKAISKEFEEVADRLDKENGR